MEPEILDPLKYADVDQIMQFFKFDHLPPKLQVVSRHFCALACDVCENVPRNPERTVALRKILEAKDAAVRAVIFETYGMQAP